MNVVRDVTTPMDRAYPVATIGNFDGQHRGHRALLDIVVATARRVQGTPLVVTFDPHPVRTLAPHVDLKFLTSPEEKLARFEEAGIQEVVFLEFTPAFAALTPQQFASQILRDRLRLREIFVGEHFTFGKGRAGTVKDLVELGAQSGFQVHAVPPVKLDGEVVSSTRIRRLIQAGDMEKGARFLGRPYAITGDVVHGDRRGRTLGWPTANLAAPFERVLPPDGVYAARTQWRDQRMASVAYIGTRPTFGAGERMIEAYFLDSDPDVYGERITVQFIERLRGDVAFKSP
ncbi:MAG TPA: bifunctional riboflavin kinase/FAD synthetase [Nitrospiraceae bacterium]|nr:bifunctional riboflavin kinase/FAD synthetase [Nitrospiraceae bacterium]